MSRNDTNPIMDKYEQDVDEIIAACRGDLRGAIKALMLINEQVRANTSTANTNPLMC